jgi:catechol 2,3-dioxygenase-like lactoylglutathione lyase family enzyme
MIEFPADGPDRARRFWSGLLGVELVERSEAEGRGWQTRSGAPVLGIHERSVGPGDTASLPYFNVADLGAALGGPTSGNPPARNALRVVGDVERIVA